MFRVLTTAAILGLTIAPALAGSAFETRVHQAASQACAVEAAPGMRPSQHYGQIFETCVNRLSREALAKARANDRLAAADRIAGN